MSEVQNAATWSSAMVLWTVCWCVASSGEPWGLAITLSPIAVALARYFCQRGR